MRGKGPLELKFAYDFVRIHSPMIYTLGNLQFCCLMKIPFIVYILIRATPRMERFLSSLLESHVTRLVHVIGRTAVPFVKKIIVPAARRVGANLLEYRVPEMAEVISGKKIKSAATSVDKKTLRKQLGGGSKRTRRFVPTKSTKINSRSRRDIFTNISR